MSIHTIFRSLALALLPLITTVAIMSCGGQTSHAAGTATAVSSPTAIVQTPSATSAASATAANNAAASPTDEPATMTPGALPATMTKAAVATGTATAASTPSSAQSISAVQRSGTPTVVGTPAANPTEQAIETVILNNNLGQMKAFASGNPAAMKDTATSSFYPEMVKSNQQLANAGATSVQLVKLVWGSISVQGTTARTTTYETWLTTYNDGTTELQVSDQNDYDLVQSGGRWLIQADNHPNSQSAAAGGPSAHRPTPTPVGTPAATEVPTSDTSRNWAGYGVASGQFTSVTGTWQIPYVNAQDAAQASTNATWVGIGGITHHDLIQAGSQAEVIGPGDIVYSTWIEMLPAAPTTVALSVVPGDSLAVTIAESRPGTWSVTLKNNTTGKTYQTTVKYRSSNSSAEWVEEAPSTQHHHIVPLDNFGTVPFTNAYAVENGKKVNLSEAGAKPITLADPNGQPMAVPSGIGSDGSSFTVRRT